MLSNGQKHVEKFHFEIEEDLEKHIPAHMISPNSPCKLIWNILIFVLIIYMAISLPIRLAFVDESRMSENFSDIDIMSDVVFVVDIILNFFFVEEDVNGELITDQKRIAVGYLKGWFCIDAVASVPISLIFLLLEFENVDESFLSIRLLKMMKFMRLYRILTLFKLTKMLRNSKIKVVDILLSYFSFHFTLECKQITTSLLRMVFLLHIVGCSFGLVALLS